MMNAACIQKLATGSFSLPDDGQSCKMLAPVPHGSNTAHRSTTFLKGEQQFCMQNRITLARAASE